MLTVPYIEPPAFEHKFLTDASGESTILAILVSSENYNVKTHH